MTSYRLAMEADAETLAGMRWDFCVEDGTAATVDRDTFVRDTGAWMRGVFSDRSWACWLAEDAGVIVSHMWIETVHKVPKPFPCTRRFGYVTNVYTKPEWRGRGIGAELMRLVQDWAIEQDLELLILWPSQRSRPFYRRAGFREENEVFEWKAVDEEATENG